MTMRRLARYHHLVRWMCRRDVDAVDAISLGTPGAMAPDEILRHMRTRDPEGSGMVYECRHPRRGLTPHQFGPVLGYFLYTLYTDRIVVHDFAVHHAYRRQRVGTAMAGQLLLKLSTHRRSRLCVDVPETNLAGLHFWRSVGLFAEGLRPGQFGEGVDGVEMVYRVGDV